MQTYWQNATNPNNIARGLYIIFPFRYRDSFQSIAIDDKDKEIPPLIFDSGDFIELLSVKCRNGNFVKRFNLNSKLEEIKEEWYRKAEASKIYHLNDLQLFIFNNGIAFITTYFAYKNEDVDKVYQLINPGYVKEKSEEMKQAQEELLEVLEAKTFCFIKGKLGLTLSCFTQDEESKKYIIKEAYRLNVAALPNRFEDNEIPKKIAYNEHRLIDVTREFTDESEKDVEYATEAKDVEDEHYGWACAITSQEISYAYGPGPGKDMPPSAEELPVRAEEDLLLTMIVMYQKYTVQLLFSFFCFFSNISSGYMYLCNCNYSCIISLSVDFQHYLTTFTFFFQKLVNNTFVHLQWNRFLHFMTEQITSYKPFASKFLGFDCHVSLFSF